MADFPLAINLQGDYGYKVVVVDDGATIEEVINTSVDQIVSVLVAPNLRNVTTRKRVARGKVPRLE